MNTSNHYDVIIIGTGAGGGTLAHTLAPSGKKILILERGDFLPRNKINWNAEEVFVNGHYNNAESWKDKDGKSFVPGQHYYVGGNTKFYGAVLFRLRKEDFGILWHEGGISPAWPLTYDDFEPYYTKAEQLYQVHGERGLDPTEPPASAPLPHPPISNEPVIEELQQNLRRIGLNPFPLPNGILMNEQAMHKSHCIRCDTCDGFPCMVNGKADAHVICVEPALEHDNVTLLTNAKALRLETDESGGSVKQVVVERHGETETYSGDIVVSSCGAINSAALLLRSANDKHSEGLGNSSGMVGRNLMKHVNSAVVVISKVPNPTKFQKTIGINDFYFKSDDYEYPLGHMQMLGKSSADMFKPMAKQIPKRVLDKLATHALDFWFTSEDLPHPENRVTIDAKGDIVLHYKDNNLEGHKRLLAKFKKMLKAANCEDKHIIPHSLYMGKQIPLAGVAHQSGTMRFGTDPATSVLDVNCKTHDVDNLYVVDGSFFVSSSAVNPALTIIANAIRVGEHLLERLK